jgi:hypothetical protein
MVDSMSVALPAAFAEQAALQAKPKG